MIIELIAAVSDNGVVALADGSLPWRMRSDLKHFRKLTEGCSLVVGRRTFGLLPRAMLDQGNRLFYVLSKSQYAKSFACRLSDEDQRARAQFYLGQSGDGQRYRLPNVMVVRSTADAINESAKVRRQHLWCIGGPGVWNDGIQYADRAVLSRVHTSVQGLVWTASSKFELPSDPTPDDQTFQLPALDRVGFHLSTLEHHARQAGDDHDWTVEHWRRGH